MIPSRVVPHSNSLALALALALSAAVLLAVATEQPLIVEESSAQRVNRQRLFLSAEDLADDSSLSSTLKDFLPHLRPSSKRTVNDEGFIETDVDERTLEEIELKFPGTLKRRLQPPCGMVQTRCQKEGYTNYTALTEFLNRTAKAYPNLTKLTSLGETVENRSIWCLEISLHPGDRSDDLPNFKYVGNMHGDEVVGRMMLIYLIDELLYEYSRGNYRIKSLVDTTHIFIVPTMNPDGFELCRRGNSANVDLNRRFPDRFDNPPVNSPADRPLEIQAIMNWTHEVEFTLSANIHGGEVVANYPYDYAPTKDGHQTGDSDIFQHLSLVYASANPPMSANREFSSGITNGADWYVLRGGMQDWNYEWEGCMEITLELSCDKWPSLDELDDFWDDNRESLIAYMEQVHIGVKGYVQAGRDSQHTLPGAEITVVDRNFVVRSRNDKQGNYFRLLVPGSYILQANMSGYHICRQPIVVTEGMAVRVDFYLTNSSDPIPEKCSGVLSTLVVAPDPISPSTPPSPDPNLPATSAETPPSLPQTPTRNLTTPSPSPSPSETQPLQPTTPLPPYVIGGEKNSSSVWGMTLIIALILAIGGLFYYWRNMRTPNPTPTRGLV